tara:strand:- start:866 stop:1066 length:201 start_codon:yes stop_codon:yes gene_type:complete
MEIPNDFVFFVHSLRMAITAPTEEDSQRVLDLLSEKTSLDVSEREMELAKSLVEFDFANHQEQGFH